MVARPSRASSPGTGMPARSSASRLGHALALVEGLALAHHDQRHLGHRGEVAAGAHRALGAHDRRDALVEQLDQRLRDLRPVARVAVGVDVDARRHGGAHDLDRRGLADAGGVVVDEEALELLHLVVVEHDLAELADAGVGAVHDLARRDLLLEHRAADLDALEGGRVELDLLALAGDAHELLDGERRAVQGDGHGCVSSRGTQTPRAGGPKGRRRRRNVLSRDCRRRPGGCPDVRESVRDYGRKWTRAASGVAPAGTGCSSPFPSSSSSCLRRGLPLRPRGLRHAGQTGVVTLGTSTSKGTSDDTHMSSGLHPTGPVQRDSPAGRRGA